MWSAVEIWIHVLGYWYTHTHFKMKLQYLSFGSYRHLEHRKTIERGEIGEWTTNRKKLKIILISFGEFCCCWISWDRPRKHGLREYTEKNSLFLLKKATETKLNRDTNRITQNRNNKSGRANGRQKRFNEFNTTYFALKDFFSLFLHMKIY